MPRDNAESGSSQLVYCTPLFFSDDQIRSQSSIKEGACGNLFKAELNNGTIIAVKQLKLSSDGGGITKHQRREYENLCSVDHRFIVKYYRLDLRCVNETPKYLEIQMEYCHTDLENIIKSHARGITNEFPNFANEVPYTFAQICLAISYLHGIKCIHRDLKPANILLTSEFMVKVCDFGLSTIMDPENSTDITAQGTPAYMAPELLKVYYRDDPNSGHGLPVDIWSLGCILYEMVTLRHPFLKSAIVPADNPSPVNNEAQNDNQTTILADDIYEAKYKPLPEGTEVNLSNLVGRMIQKAPNDRPTINEVLQDPYLYQAVNHLEESFRQSNFNEGTPLPVEIYVPTLDVQNRDCSTPWLRWSSLQIRSKNQKYTIDFSEFPRNDPNFSWVFSLWETMVGENFLQHQDLHLPRIHLSMMGEECIVEIYLLRRYSQSSRACAPQLFICGKSLVEGNSCERFNFSITITCALNDGGSKTYTNTSLLRIRDRAEAQKLYTFSRPEWNWAELHAESPPRVTIWVT